ncbi:hypothetical protein HY604_00595 [Candidatus Peregrinibacteria bacterium]|nr:hypothetical protein [Candidatus Peregrinibacteria bacterium]
MSKKRRKIAVMQGDAEFMTKPYAVIRRVETKQSEGFPYEAVHNSKTFLKCQFHCHVQGDPLDNIQHTAKELLTHAKKVGFDVVSITCHRKIHFSKTLEQYAQKLDILLIPGIEFEINGKHILCINAHKNIEKVDSYEKLEIYKKAHQDSLIIAAHPFFPGKIALQKDLPKNIDLFDAIENSFCYTKKIDFNKKAQKLAQQHNKPFLALADCHILPYLDIGYIKVKAQKNASAIIKAIKNHQYQNFTEPKSLWQITKILFQMYMLGFRGKRGRK